MAKKPKELTNAESAISGLAGTVVAKQQIEALEIAMSKVRSDLTDLNTVYLFGGSSPEFAQQRQELIKKLSTSFPSIIKQFEEAQNTAFIAARQLLESTKKP